LLLDPFEATLEARNTGAQQSSDFRALGISDAIASLYIDNSSESLNK
jgi:hypothetical protein